VSNQTTTNEIYVDWIVRNVFLSRTPAQPNVMARAMRLFASSVANIDDEAIRELVTLRLLQHRRFAAAVHSDTELTERFARYFAPIKTIGTKVFKQEDFLNGMRDLSRGKLSQLSDRLGNPFDFRLACVVAERLSGVAVMSGSTIVAFDADWRSFVPHASHSDIQRLVSDRTEALELTSTEAAALIASLQTATPVGRIRILDDHFRSLAYLQLVEIQASLNNGVYPEEVVPVNPTMLARYIGLDNSDEVDLEAITARTLARTSAVEALVRLMGLPMRLLPSVVEAAAKEAGGIKPLIHLVLRVRLSPVSLLHVLRIVAAHASTERAFCRLFSRLSASVLRLLSSGEFDAYIHWIRWISDELLRRPVSGAWAPAKRYAIAWVYGQQTMRLLVDGSVADVTARKSRYSGHEEVLYGALSGLLVPYNPQIVGAERLVLGALGDEDIFHSDLARTSVEALLPLIKVDYANLPWAPSLFNTLLAGNDWLTADTPVLLRRLLGEQLADEDEIAFSPEHLDVALSAVGNDPTFLPFINSRTFGVTAPPAALEYARSTTLAQECRRDLYDASPTIWKTRIGFIARILAVYGDDTDADAFHKYWLEIAKEAAADDSYADKIAFTLIESIAFLTRRGERFSDRAKALSARMLELMELSAPFAQTIGMLVQRIAKRLPSDCMTEDLGKALLLARFRGAARA
jgi:hypothetical protein